MEPVLRDKKVAIIVSDGFEETELTVPLQALRQAGAHVDVVSVQEGKVQAWSHDHWSLEYPVDKLIQEIHHEDYDAVVIPGGVMNPDRLRMDHNVVHFIKHFFEEGKPIAAICHGLWVLIETGELIGRRVTSYPSLHTDLVNAGAMWEDKEVVVDQGLVTSRRKEDLPAFCRKLIEEIAEGKHRRKEVPLMI